MNRSEIEQLLRPLLDVERRCQEGERELAEANRKAKAAKDKIATAVLDMRKFAREYMEPSLFDDPCPSPTLS